MEKSNITIRLEKKEEHQKVENLVRESFWNVYRPGCLEHYVLHQLRNDPAFVPELDFVMLLNENDEDGKLIGQNMFMRTSIKADDGRNIPIMTMGPICITPELKRQGYGKVLLNYTVIFAGKSALEILRMMVGRYFHMNQQEHMLNFYKVIYSERSIQPMAAKILAEETEKMIIATKQLFYAMEVHKLLHFQNADMSAVSFAMTVHGLMDYELDLRSGGCKTENQERNDLDEYLQWFCKENAVK